MAAMTGDELREMRVRKEWGQSQLATHLKVTTQYVGMMERGEKDIPSHIEKAARDALDKSARPDFYVPDEKLYKEAQKAVLTAIQKYPTLTINGFRYFYRRDELFENMKTECENRASLFSDYSLAEIATAIRWIDSVKIIKTPKCGSYGAKHRAENWGRENGLASYVANGALIVAAIHRNVPIRLEPNSPNAVLGLNPDPMPEPKVGTFAHWLRTQTKREDPVGDLADEAVTDRTFPQNTSSRPRLRSYLANKGACEEAFEALDEALGEWRTLKKADGGRKRQRPF